MQDFDGKTAVVTGAASGIGKALSKAFGERGMNVVMADINKEALAEAKGEISLADGREVIDITTDVTRYESVEALANAAYDKFGAVHVLCNNAGVLIGGAIHESDLKDWEWVLKVNLWGVIYGVHAFTPRMVAAGEPAHIVNTASLAGHFATPNNGIYNTSKFAVVGFSESLSRDLKPHNIGVSILSPGQVDTNIFTSYQNRPAEYESGNTGAYDRRQSDNVHSPDQVAAKVIEGIEHGRMYVFPHAEESRTVLNVRHDRMMRDVVID